MTLRTEIALEIITVLCAVVLLMQGARPLGLILLAAAAINAIALAYRCIRSRG